MKEYLVKDVETGKYFLTENHSNFVGAIEVPEDAIMLLYCESNNGFYHFANAENKLMATYAMKNGNASWYGNAESYIQFGAEVVWRREQEIKMKEYLRKNINGEFELIKVPEQEAKELHADSWLEVPDGAEFLTRLDTSEETVLIFWKEGYKKCLCCDDDWVSDQPPMSNYMDSYQANIVWRREKTVEYLDPSNWSLKVVGENSPISKDYILVPKGSERLTIDDSKTLTFWNGDNSFNVGYGGEWVSPADGVMDFDAYCKHGYELLWTRHTQPEEFPFIDDEPKYKELDQLILENSENVTIPESWLKDDAVNHPNHYTTHPSGIECIEITRHHDFAIGNAIKYLWRAGLKDSDNEVQDLKKAIWYIQDKINQLEKSNGGDN